MRTPDFASGNVFVPCFSRKETILSETLGQMNGVADVKQRFHTATCSEMGFSNRVGHTQNIHPVLWLVTVLAMVSGWCWTLYAWSTGSGSISQKETGEVKKYPKYPKGKPKAWLVQSVIS